MTAIYASETITPTPGIGLWCDLAAFPIFQCRDGLKAEIWLGS